MNQTVLQKLKRKHKDWTGFRAEQLSHIAENLHLNAPRGGKSINAFGQPRSAPYEVPAIEYGDLLAKLQQPVKETSDGFEVNVNNVEVEYGHEGDFGYVAPRPLGRIALEEFKQNV